MRKRLRSSVSYANVASTVALFIALGGVSYAAVTLPNNSVGTKQLKKSAVTLAKISSGAQGALRGSTGAAGATGAAGPAGAAGSVGAQGPTGDQGPPGAQGLAGAPGLKGDRGDPGLQGIQGIQGDPGSARAYGEVTALGIVSNAKGSPTITTPGAGHYCLTVPGVDPSTTTIGVTLSVSSDANSAPPSESPGDGVPCTVGTWEISMGTLTSPVAAAEPIVFALTNEPFSFIVP